MKIFIITICNKKEDYSNNLIKKYIHLIKKFYKLSYIDISFKTEKVKKNLYDKEYRKAISLIKPNSTLVALDENGEHMSSLNFSKKIKLLVENNAQIYFLIGGPDGLSDFVREKADLIVSLSDLTFPHQLAKIILTEQIYRSICIMNNHPYHRS
jgi:23S rRNA (pseudouridine1915-N3)-methyltransferase